MSLRSSSGAVLLGRFIWCGILTKKSNFDETFGMCLRSGSLAQSSSPLVRPILIYLRTPLLYLTSRRITSHFSITTAGDDIAAHPDFFKRFLYNIQCVLADQGLSMAFKRKLEIGIPGSSKQYKKLVQEMSQKSNVTIVPPEVLATQLVGQCAAVISMPFTSNAPYWREQNIPSTYYDPTGWIQRDDRAAHGIPVLIGIEELRRWISDTFGNDQS